jgi:hypothetical protein
MKRVVAVFGLSCLAIGFQPAASAQEASSAYTRIDLRRDCAHRPGRSEEDYGQWRCKGLAGMPIWASAGDQRMYVSFGPRAEKEPAAGQTLAPFNHFYAGAIEWRIAGGRPFATIVRWKYKTEADRDTPDASGEALVVTRLPPGPVCQVGYVDARANADANELARRIADERARRFVCGVDKPAILGKIGAGAGFLSER